MVGMVVGEVVGNVRASGRWEHTLGETTSSPVRSAGRRENITYKRAMKQAKKKEGRDDEKRGSGR